MPTMPGVRWPGGAMFFLHMFISPGLCSGVLFLFPLEHTHAVPSVSPLCGVNRHAGPSLFWGLCPWLFSSPGQRTRLKRLRGQGLLGSQLEDAVYGGRGWGLKLGGQSHCIRSGSRDVNTGARLTF